MVTSWLCATAARARLPPRRAAMRRYRACRWEFFLRKGAQGGGAEGGLEPAVARASRCGLGLAGGLVVARADPGPGGEVRGAGKAGHLHADLGDDHLGGAGVDTVDGGQQLDLGPVGASSA